MPPVVKGTGGVFALRVRERKRRIGSERLSVVADRLVSAAAQGAACFEYRRWGVQCAVACTRRGRSAHAAAKSRKQVWEAAKAWVRNRLWVSGTVSFCVSGSVFACACV